MILPSDVPTVDGTVFDPVPAFIKEMLQNPFIK